MAGPAARAEPAAGDWQGRLPEILMHFFEAVSFLADMPREAVLTAALRGAGRWAARFPLPLLPVQVPRLEPAAVLTAAGVTALEAALGADLGALARQAARGAALCRGAARFVPADG